MRYKCGKKLYKPFGGESTMRALDPSSGTYLPPRGRYATVYDLVFRFGYSLALIDAMVATQRLLWVGTRYLFL